ncbi:MAG: aspartate 1-decarboxylase [Rhodospirillales bacterium]|nr:aspartate 1-decarboxylase [Rhodospirillales bacterium]
MGDIGGSAVAVQVPMLLAKIHRATVTDADLHYEGSITIDRTLMDLATLVAFQQVQVYNVSNGARFETYVIEGEADSGCICINGAAAHLAGTGDIVIIAAYVSVPAEAVSSWRPRTVYVDAANRPLPARSAAAE